MLPRGKEDENFGIDFAALTGTSDDENDPASVLCAAIDEARRNKDFSTADTLRKQLIEAGYDVSTSKEGTIARKKLA